MGVRETLGPTWVHLDSLGLPLVHLNASGALRTTRPGNENARLWLQVLHSHILLFALLLGPFEMGPGWGLTQYLVPNIWHQVLGVK